MPNSKVRPIVAFNWPDMKLVEPHDDDQLQIGNKWQDFDYWESGITRNDRDYWQARREFLNSYRFSEEKDDEVKGKLKRSVKALHEAAMGVVLDIRKEVSKRKLGFRVFRFKFALSSLVSVSIRCFTPWLERKRDLIE